MQETLGVLLPVVEAALNHTEPNGMTRIYQHHKYRDEMRNAWTRLGAHLDKLMRKKSSSCPSPD